MNVFIFLFIDCQRYCLLKYIRIVKKLLSKVYLYKNKRVFNYKKDNNEGKSFIIEALNCLFYFLMTFHKSVRVFRGIDKLLYLVGLESRL